MMRLLVPGPDFSSLLPSTSLLVREVIEIVCGYQRVSRGKDVMFNLNFFITVVPGTATAGGG